MTDTVKMPKPYATLHHDDGYFTTKQREHTGKPFRTEVITMEQAKQYGDDRAREASEKAAKVSDKFKQPSQTKATRVLAALISHDIRALAKEIK